MRLLLLCTFFSSAFGAGLNGFLPPVPVDGNPWTEARIRALIHQVIREERARTFGGFISSVGIAPRAVDTSPPLPFSSGVAPHAVDTNPPLPFSAAFAPHAVSSNPPLPFSSGVAPHAVDTSPPLPFSSGVAPHSVASNPPLPFSSGVAPRPQVQYNRKPWISGVHVGNQIIESIKKLFSTGRARPSSSTSVFPPGLHVPPPPVDKSAPKIDELLKATKELLSKYSSDRLSSNSWKSGGPLPVSYSSYTNVSKQPLSNSHLPARLPPRFPEYPGWIEEPKLPTWRSYWPPKDLPLKDDVYKPIPGLHV